MSFIHNHNFLIYFTLPALKKRVLIISFALTHTVNSISFNADNSRTKEIEA